MLFYYMGPKASKAVLHPETIRELQVEGNVDFSSEEIREWCELFELTSVQNAFRCIMAMEPQITDLLAHRCSLTRASALL